MTHIGKKPIKFELTTATGETIDLLPYLREYSIDGEVVYTTHPPVYAFYLRVVRFLRQLPRVWKDVG